MHSPSIPHFCRERCLALNDVQFWRLLLRMLTADTCSSPLTTTKDILRLKYICKVWNMMVLNICASFHVKRPVEGESFKRNGLFWNYLRMTTADVVNLPSASQQLHNAEFTSPFFLRPRIKCDNKICWLFQTSSFYIHALRLACLCIRCRALTSSMINQLWCIFLALSYRSFLIRVRERQR